MGRPVLLDLFCGPGGATVGYQRAGFDVVGVDVEPWACYPGDCHAADAMAVLRGEVAGLEPWRFDAIHASPPCHAYSATTPMIRAAHTAEGRTNRVIHADLLGPVRDALGALGIPYVIENVVGAPGRWDALLCGTMFGLPVRRHRLFAFGSWSSPTWPPMGCNHALVDPVASAYYSASRRKELGVRQRDAERTLLDALGLSWVPIYAYENRGQPGAIEGIPPAYTEWIGRLLAGALA